MWIHKGKDAVVNFVNICTNNEVWLYKMLWWVYVVGNMFPIRGFNINDRFTYTDVE
jgi:hypothetical protein